ncbi:hypothetical protein [Pasteurella multocida]|uniref:hypothetical protein n=1 Tax=Pasteurella multocida TaxID=747 RepID=UPI002AFF5889|nr:hypothetical protein [Pasteurella multocida]
MIKFKIISLWLLAVLISHILISSILSPYKSADYIFYIAIIFGVLAYLYYKKYTKKHFKLNNQITLETEQTIEITKLEKGDIIKFEYQHSNGDEKFYSVKLIDIEFDGDDDFGFYAVLIAENKNKKIQRFKDYHAGEIVYKGKKYSSFEELYSLL